ncbi:MAG TPA: UDP-N-acetylmuramate dehydrogenase [Roseiflexaceae bacterium]|nr:UDP-N-acetylmuramate dehydrogenase [Roseiflexaceae bacterium]HMP38777.1 UDP-N-acetylmuramate dehydrogenase [Roseiflexaceae bacterium]
MIELHYNEPLAKYTSWRIGGPAAFFTNAADIDGLRAALQYAHDHNLPPLLLGGGTNMLVGDSGWPGMVIRFRDQHLAIAVDGDQALAWVGAGAPMAGTARRLTRRGWAGLEWAEGLPGTIGGAVFGNAGCYGGDIAGTLITARLLVGEQIEEWPVARFGYGYRTSVLKAQRGNGMPIIVAAAFALTRGDPAVLGAQIDATAALRRSKTPWGSSCGSVFKNPPGQSAGRLIEAAGLKGTRVGAAEIAEKHANYIVNLGGATSRDVVALIELARERVLREFGITLELEVQIVG